MNSSELTPLKFKPIVKNKIWGGTKLGDVLGKDVKDNHMSGESWELSGVPGNISVVSEGEFKNKNLTELIQTYKGKLVGQAVYDKFGLNFPLLIKFIDANDDLSIQVHPNDELAKERHDSFGKTEMWYVVDADPGSTLISGFNRPTTKEEYVTEFEAGRLSELLNVEKVQNDDVYFLPAGRVHTIGKGLLIAEIQQTSDVTYRIYDFDRVDADGNQRDLHVEEALDAIDFNHYSTYKTPYNKDADESELVKCEYFHTFRLSIEKESNRDYSAYDSFVVLMCLQGSGAIHYAGGELDIKMGETVLIPNSMESIKIMADSTLKLLEVYVP